MLWSPLLGVPGVEDDNVRLCVLTAGVMKGVCAAGVLSEEEVGVDRVLSRLRERLDDEGEIGTPACAMSGSVLIRTPFGFALRLRARSLCSLKKLLSILRGVSGPR